MLSDCSTLTLNFTHHSCLLRTFCSLFACTKLWSKQKNLSKEWAYARRKKKVHDKLIHSQTILFDSAVYFSKWNITELSLLFIIFVCSHYLLLLVVFLFLRHQSWWWCWWWCVYAIIKLFFLKLKSSFSTMILIVC
jgi:hypothetical protein